MEPPWKKFPYPQQSMGWRMGAGETYLDEWRQWFRQLNIEEKTGYISQYPEPEDWFEFYNLSLISNREELKEILNRADKLREKYLEQQYMLAVQYEKSGQKEKALAHFEKIVIPYKRSKWGLETISRYAVLKRALANEMALKKMTRDSWKMLENSKNRERIEIQRTFTLEEYKKIQRGFIPSDYENSWITYIESDTLYIHRKWTEPCLFLVKFQHDGQTYSIAEAWMNIDPSVCNLILKRPYKYRNLLLADLIESILVYSEWA